MNHWRGMVKVSDTGFWLWMPWNRPSSWVRSWNWMSYSSSGERIWNPGPNRVIAGILGIGSGMSKRDEGSSADGPTPEAEPPAPTSSETAAVSDWRSRVES